MNSDFNQVNASVRYLFVRGEHDEREPRFEYPARDTWEEAAADAIADGCAEWVRANELRLYKGKIERVRYV